MAVLTGSAPVAAMRDYQREVTAYTRGCGRLFCSLKGYEPCREPEKVIETAGYDPEGDMENPTGSVFCAHGAGFVVPWDQVEDYMHLEPVLKPAQKSERGAEDFSEKAARAGERDMVRPCRMTPNCWKFFRGLTERQGRSAGDGTAAETKERAHPACRCGTMEAAEIRSRRNPICW